MKALIYQLTLLLIVSPASLCADEEAPALVETAVAVLQDELTTELRLTGTVVSQRRSRLSSRTEGLVEQVKVDAGSRVEKGDLLLTLDTKLANLDLDLIYALIATAEVQLADAIREREEVKGLTDSGAVAKSIAASRVTNAHIRTAELNALKVREAQQLERIERHRLVAPFSGTIARKAAEAGEWVETGATVFELIETDSLWFELQVAQEFLPAIRAVEGATLKLDAFPDQPLAAEIDVIVPVKDPVSRTFLTRLTLEDPKKLASPGMSGTGILRIRPKESGNVTIPRDAVMRFPDGSAKVWMVQQENGSSTVKSATILTTGALGESIEVVEGLEGGEIVVVRGNEGLTEGQQVKPREQSTPGAREDR